MRVAVVTRYPAQVGGTSARAWWGLKALARRGHVIRVVTDSPAPPSAQTPAVAGDLRVQRPPLLGEAERGIAGETELGRLTAALCDVVEREQCELIDARFLVPHGLAGFLAGQLTARPVALRHAVTDVTRLWPAPAFKPLLDRVAARAAGVLTRPGWFPRLEQAGVAPSRLHAVQDAVDTDAFRPDVTPMDLARRVPSLPAGVPVLLHVAKHSGFADTRRLLLALATLDADAFALLVVVPPGPPRQALEAAAADVMLTRAVHTLDPVMPWEVPSLLNAVSALVYPGTAAVAPHTSELVRQAFAAGRVVVLADVVARDLGALVGHPIEHDGHAVLYEADEPGELAAAVRRVLRADVRFRLALGDAARALALITESPDAAAQSVEKAWAAVAAQR